MLVFFYNIICYICLLIGKCNWCIMLKVFKSDILLNVLYIIYKLWFDCGILINVVLKEMVFFVCDCN